MEVVLGGGEEEEKSVSLFFFFFFSSADSVCFLLPLPPGANSLPFRNPNTKTFFSLLPLPPKKKEEKLGKKEEEATALQVCPEKRENCLCASSSIPFPLPPSPRVVNQSGSPVRWSEGGGEGRKEGRKERVGQHKGRRRRRRRRKTLVCLSVCPKGLIMREGKKLESSSSSSTTMMMMKRRKEENEEGGGGEEEETRLVTLRPSRAE